MAEVLRPQRGGMLRPFGAAIFIRDFLAGEGPKYGTSCIDPKRGAPQSDIHGSYKLALHMAMAEDSAAWEAEDAIRAGRPLTPEQVEERSRFYLDRIPYKLTKMRYSSFTNYFSRLIKLGWVERTGKEEPSEAQEDWSDARPRIYYRLTDKGRAAPLHEWSDPLWPLYHYPRAKRSAVKRRLYYVPPQQRGRPRKGPPAPVAPPKPPPPAPVGVPAFQLAEKPSRGAAQSLIKHLRLLDKLDPEAPEVVAEMERLDEKFESWMEPAEEALGREEEKENPNEDRLARLEERRDALLEVNIALEDQEIEAAIAALEEAFPPPRKPSPREAT